MKKGYRLTLRSKTTGQVEPLAHLLNPPLAVALWDKKEAVERVANMFNREPLDEFYYFVTEYEVGDDWHLLSESTSRVVHNIRTLTEEEIATAKELPLNKSNLRKA